MEIISSRHFIKDALKHATYQDEFKQELKCKHCGHRMLPVFVLNDQEGIFCTEPHIPELKKGEFWFHDSTAIAVYLCVSPECGKMEARWNQA